MLDSAKTCYKVIENIRGLEVLEDAKTYYRVPEQAKKY